MENRSVLKGKWW